MKRKKLASEGVKKLLYLQLLTGSIEVSKGVKCKGGNREEGEEDRGGRESEGSVAYFFYFFLL